MGKSIEISEVLIIMLVIYSLNIYYVICNPTYIFDLINHEQ